MNKKLTLNKIDWFVFVAGKNGKQILLSSHMCVLVSASGYFREIVGMSDLDFGGVC